jgi:hypothetical protein
LAKESVPIASLLFIKPRHHDHHHHPTTGGGGGRLWLTKIQNGFHRALLQDRHYLCRIEENMCIAKMDQGDYVFHSIDGFRVILAHHFNNTLNVRELPVSLLRLYFSGHQHFCQILDQLSLSAREQLRLYTTDALLYECLTFILDATFCSFERTLVMMANCRSEWPDFGLKEALKSDSFFVNMPKPSAYSLETHLVWYAVMWRIHVTLQIEKLLKPWEINSYTAEKQKAWLLYRMKLYRDTHLDLSTLMVHRDIYDDLSLQPFLVLYWPTSGRVCCLEELPDLSKHSLDNLQTGTNLKDRDALKKKLGHFFFNKGMNNICGNRNYHEIHERYAEQDPIIADMTKLNTRCMLLGNTPGSRGHLNWITRIRINFSFWPSYADVLMTKEEIHRVVPLPRNPFIAHKTKLETKLAKARENGIPEEQIILDSEKIERQRLARMTRYNIFILRCAYYISSLMREYLFEVLEFGESIDAFFSLDYKWNAYKEIIRIGNGHCRIEMASQMASCTLNDSMDWFVIEYIEKLEGNNYANKRGKIMEFHDLVLDVTTKVLKRDYIGIIKVKATATEKNMPIGPEPLEPIWEDESVENRTKPTLEEMDFIAWYMAQSDVLETRWFQCLGVSEIGLSRFRKWYSKYIDYEPADDSYKKKIVKLQQHSHNDYFIIMSIINLIIYHKSGKDLFYLPLCMAKRTANAIRKKQLYIADHEESPPLMGMSYRCHGCRKFACSVVPPLNYRMQSNYSELTREHNQIYFPGQSRRPLINGITHQHLRLIVQNQSRIIEPYKSQLSRIGQNRNTISLRKTKKKKKDKQLEEDEETKRLEMIAEEENRQRRENISFLTIAFYNITDGKPYCIRNKRKVANSGGGGDGGGGCDDDQSFQPILLSKRNGTIIEINRPLITAESEMIQDDKYLNEFDVVDIATNSDHEGEEEQNTYRPDYEHNPLLINPRVNDMERLRRILNQDAASANTTPIVNGIVVVGKRNKKIEEALKKKRISNHILAPLNQLYHCRLPLEPINTIGIVIGNKTRCVDCGVMTEINEHNMTSHGPSCMREINRSFTRNHPVWDIDTHNIAAMHQVVGPDMKDCKQKKLHHADLLDSHYTTLHTCDFCKKRGAMQWITVCNTEFETKKRMACKECYRLQRVNLTKNYMVPDPVKIV